MRIRQNRKRANRTACSLVFAVIAGLLCLGAALAALWVSSADAAPDLTPAERLALAAYLTARDADLARTGGGNSAPVDFTVQPGETANDVAKRLAAQKLVFDGTLLGYYMRYTGLDQKIEAGDFVLRQTMTLKEVAQTLTDAKARQISIRIFEG
jgi:cell division protein YceG involved in septum cleavage